MDKLGVGLFGSLRAPESFFFFFFYNFTSDTLCTNNVSAMLRSWLC